MAERLYDLLPAVYRLQDAQRGQPLRALLSVLERELDALRADIDTSWENAFIETCEEWLVPYIGELLGVRGIRSVPSAQFSQRAFVANTLGYRRGKGTAAVVERLAQDLTGCAAKVVEYFRHTLISAHMRHVREARALPARGGTIDLRSQRQLAQLNTAFDAQAHRADVRHIASGRGRYNLPQLGIFLWRLQSFEVSGASAVVSAAQPAFYRFHPFGFDAPLYNLPATKSAGAPTEAHNVAHALSRRELFDELAGDVPARNLSPDPAFVVRTERAGVLSPPWPIEICDLSDVAGALPAKRPPQGKVSVDPELGRITFSDADLPPAGQRFEVVVDYAYGFSSELGAGPFDRSRVHLTQLGSDQLGFVCGVSRDLALQGTGVVTTLAAALSAWNDYLTGLAEAERGTATGAIVLLDNRRYDAPTDAIALPAGARLHLLSAKLRSAPPGPPTVLAQRACAVVHGDLKVRGGSSMLARARRGGLFLNGIFCTGQLRVEPGDLEDLDLAHVTFTSHRRPSIEIASEPGLTNATLSLRIARCLLSGLRAAGPLASAEVVDSLCVAEPALHLPGTTVSLCASTLVGSIRAGVLSASNAILEGPIEVAQHQAGCLRFCYARAGERTPRRYRCQPDLALSRVPQSAQAPIVARLRPRFASLRLGDPAYGQLLGPPELTRAAEDESELGVFHHLMHPLREANLHAALRQYLRFGMEAGLMLES